MDGMSLEAMKQYRGMDEVPADFDEFWDAQIANLELPTDYTLEEQDFGIPNVIAESLTFTGTNNGEISAKLLFPKREEKVPVIFKFHGYMGRSKDWSELLKYVACGYGVVAMDVRGQAGFSNDRRAFDGMTVTGQIVRGMTEGPEQLFYRDVYLDVYTLIELVTALPNVDENNLQCTGGSQGGALSIAGAALNPRIKQIVIQYPFLSDFRRVLRTNNQSDAYNELIRYFKFTDPFHETEDAVIETLSYIDVKNMAHRINVPVKMFVSVVDDICYPSTQFAVYNRLGGEKEYVLMHEYEHEAMNVFVNDAVMNWLCGTTIDYHKH
ncbi:acetylxylan esterase [Aerococcus vaginalis]